MAEIVPMTSFNIYYNVPLTSDYINTFYFSNATQQDQYFNTKFTKRTVPLESYQRKSRGWLRVNLPYRDVYNANYMSFINTQELKDGAVYSLYEQKTYYAFILDVVYINDAVSEIHYDIDVIQSFMFDWTFEDVYVERETTNSDNIGEHLLDEGIPVGDYVYSHGNQLQFSETGLGGYSLDIFDYVVASTMDIDYKDSTEGGEPNSYISGVITGCKLLRFTQLTGQGGILTWLNNIPGGREGNVLAVFMCPRVINFQNELTDKVVTKAFVRKYNNAVGTDGDWYTPQNKKLLSSPYNNLFIQSSSGESVIFDYSKLSDVEIDNVKQIQFSLFFNYTYPVTGILFPTSKYKGYEHPMGYGLPLPTIPSCTWSTDTFKAWAALNTGYIISSMAGSIIDAGIQIGSAIAGANAISTSGIASFNSASFSGASQQALEAIDARTKQSQFANQSRLASGIVGDIQNITNNLISIHNAKLAPDCFNGSAQNLLAAGCRYYGFVSYQKSIRADYAKQLDEYFTMFGYRVNTIKSPTLQNRTRFTYIKTANMCLHGLIPQNYIEKICTIFNAGIRFWVDRDNIGIYKVYNSGTLQYELLPNTPGIMPSVTP